LKAYAEAGVPVERFEVWLVNSKGQWTGMFPTRDGNEAICVYEVQPNHDETTKDFALRCARDILEIVEATDLESLILEKALPWVRYNLYVEEEYKSEQKGGSEGHPQTCPPPTPGLRLLSFPTQ
jgi:hypothetical protein